jgi:lipopolysaccharide export LptBFGC system permease protein LptF
MEDGGWLFENATQYLEAAGTNTIPQLVLQTNSLAMPQFTETPELVRSEIKVSRRLGVGESKRSDLAISEILNYLRLHPNPSKSDAAWLHTKLQGRLASPWTCLVVVLIALPFGAASGRRNVFVGVAASIAIAFSYFVLQQLGLALGTGGYLPPWLAAWLPNLIFGLAGVWMAARVR